MTFEEWWDEVGHNLWCDNDDIFLSDLVKAAWEAAFDEGVKWALKQDANTINKLMLTLEELK